MIDLERENEYLKKIIEALQLIIFELEDRLAEVEKLLGLDK